MQYIEQHQYDARIENGRAWMTIKQVADFIGMRSTYIKHHIKIGMSRKTIDPNDVEFFLLTAPDGKRHLTRYVGPAAIRELGYDLKSRVTTARVDEYFKWATTTQFGTELVLGSPTPTQPPSATDPAMADQLTTFQFGNFPIRTAGTPDAPLFRAQDVCQALGIADAADACKRLDSDEQELIRVETGSGRKHATYVNESGLYALILGSRKPEAKAFKRWVTSEVLPAIRKTGKYESSKVADSKSDVLPLADLATVVATSVVEALTRLGYGRRL
jgi:prophage antirepressor-like protein